MKPLALCALSVLVAATPPALGENADRDKPIQVEAAKFSGSDLKQVAVFTGNVVVTKGTMKLNGERVELRKDPEGYDHAVVTAAPGQLAKFRQRRDATRPGLEEFLEGYAERIEYDGKSETIKFVRRAQVLRLENDQQRDEIRGEQITYDSRTTEYEVDGRPAQGTDGRVRMTIAPRSAPSAAASAPATPLKPAPNPPTDAPR